MSDIALAPKPAPTLESLGFKTEPELPSNKWEGQLSILAGPPKSGKSEFLAQGGETTWFIRMADEFQHLTTYGVNCRDFNDVEREVARLHKAKNAGIFKWDTVVFDPSDKLLEYVSDAICEEKQAESIYEVAGYGIGQRMYKNKIKGLVSSLLLLPAHVFFVFHSKEKEIGELNNENKKYTKTIIDLSDKLDVEFQRRILNTLMLKVGYVGEMSSRALVTQGTKFIESGCKAPCLSEKKYLQWGPDSKVNYANFRKLFN